MYTLHRTDEYKQSINRILDWTINKGGILLWTKSSAKFARTTHWYRPFFYKQVSKIDVKKLTFNQIVVSSTQMVQSILYKLHNVCLYEDNQYWQHILSWFIIDNHAYKTTKSLILFDIKIKSSLTKSISPHHDQTWWIL